MRVKPKATNAVFRSRQSKANLLLQLRAKLGDVEEMDSIDNRRPYEEEDVDELSPERAQNSLEDATMGEQQFFRPVPSLFTSLPTIRDALITNSTRKRDDTIEQCLPHLSGTYKNFPHLNSQSVSKLEREKHVAFLKAALQDANFIPYDASRPWVVYWSLTGLSLLGENVEVFSEK